MKHTKHELILLLLFISSLVLLAGCGQKQFEKKIMKAEIITDDQGSGFPADTLTREEWADYAASSAKTNETYPDILDILAFYRYHSNGKECVSFVLSHAPMLDNTVCDWGVDLFEDDVPDSRATATCYALDENGKETEESVLAYILDTVRIDPSSANNNNASIAISCQLALIDSQYAYDSIESSSNAVSILYDGQKIGYATSTFQPDSTTQDDENYWMSYSIVKYPNLYHCNFIIPIRIEEDGTIIAMHEQLVISAEYTNWSTKQKQQLDDYFANYDISDWSNIDVAY